ncbi:MAG: dihydrofolate reductase [Acidobacteriota bacterium]
MTLSLIAAVSRNGIIGRGGSLPWRLPADLARFKRLTLGHHLIMGRKTFESIGRPLPGRTILVVSRRTGYAPAGVQVVSSPAEAMEQAVGDPEPFVAGGAQIFEQMLPECGRLYLTRIHQTFQGDVSFPSYDPSAWTEILREDHPAETRNPHPHTFLIYQRR